MLDSSVGGKRQASTAVTGVTRSSPRRRIPFGHGGARRGTTLSMAVTGPTNSLWRRRPNSSHTASGGDDTLYGGNSGEDNHVLWGRQSALTKTARAGTTRLYGGDGDDHVAGEGSVPGKAARPEGDDKVSMAIIGNDFVSGDADNAASGDVRVRKRRRRMAVTGTIGSLVRRSGPELGGWCRGRRRYGRRRRRERQGVWRCPGICSNTSAGGDDTIRQAVQGTTPCGATVCTAATQRNRPGPTVFVFAPGSDIDTIQDFETGKDTLDVAAPTRTSTFSDITGQHHRSRRATRSSISAPPTAATAGAGYRHGPSTMRALTRQRLHLRALMCRAVVAADHAQLCYPVRRDLSEFEPAA